jgi:hypothetical protein
LIRDPWKVARLWEDAEDAGGLKVLLPFLFPNRVMKKDWNSHIRAKNPIDVTPAKAGVQCLLL